MADSPTDNAVTDLATDSFVAASPDNLDYMLELQDQSNQGRYAPKVHGHEIADTEGLQAALDSKSDEGHAHDERYYTESETDAKLATKSDATHLHDDRYFTEDEVTAKLATKSDTTHLHDDRYYTETEADELLATKSDEGHVHDERYYTKEGADELLDGKSDVGHAHDDRYFTETEVTSKLATKSDAGHTHDDRYFTEAEVTSKLATKSDAGHRHDNATASADGFMASEDKSKLDGIEAGANLVTLVSQLTNDSDYQTLSEVNAIVSQAVASALTWQGAVATVADLPSGAKKGHVYHVNEDGGEYAWDGTEWVELGSVIEHKWSSITGKPSTFAPSAHTHPQADVTGLEAALAGKAAASHTHDDRYFTEAEVTSKLAGKSDVGHAHGDLYYTEGEVDAKLAEKSDADHLHDGRYYTEAEVDSKLAGKAAASHTHAQADVTGLADALAGKAATGHTHDDRYYTESETDAKLATKANSSHTHTTAQVTGLDAALAGKAAASHTHTIAQVTNLQSTLDGKAATGHTHNYAGAASAGGAATSANKVNETQLANVDLNDYRDPGTFYFGGGGNGCTNKPSGVDAFGMLVMRSALGFFTQILYGLNDSLWVRQGDVTNWNGWARVYSTTNKPTPADLGAAASSHTHGAATQSANGFMSANDKKKLDGIATGANAYTHPGSAAGAVNAGLWKIATDAQGHVTAATAVTKADITALGIPGTNTTYGLASTSANGLLRQLDGSTAHFMRGDGTWATPPNTTYGVATSSANGLMSAADKSKLDSISVGASGEIEIDLTIDSALSATSTNPVQNKVVTSALNGKAATSHTHGNATTGANGFMSATDKAKLDGIATGANKTVVDSALSATSANPVQNKVVKAALDGKAATSHTHSYLPLSGGTVTGETVFQRGVYVHSANGTSGTAGFVNIAQISLAGTSYQNVPIELEVFRRGTSAPTRLYIAFASANGADPSLASFTYDGAGGGTDFYLHKSATSTWQLYIRKTEAYDSVGIAWYGTNFPYMNHAITWKNVQASSAPSGATAATHVSVASHTHTIAQVTNLQSTLDGKAASSHSHSAANITSGTLPVARGGTGVTANPSLLVNLGSTAAAGAFAASPRPGVTGTLPIANGGTGATSASAARTALGLGGAATKALSTGTNARDAVAYVAADGVMEIGHIIDFHAEDNDGKDYTARLTASSDGFSMSKPLNVASGGTGATSAAAARTRLGITPENIGAAASSHTHDAAQVTGLTASRALVSDASGHPAASAVTATELGYLDGVTGAIQTQLDGKAASGHTHTPASIGAAAADHEHDATEITSGVLLVARGGTGQVTAAGIRNSLGLGNTTAALPIANGGTGATTAAQARANLGLDNIQLNFGSDEEVVAFCGL